MQEADWKNIKYFKRDDFADDKGDCWIKYELVVALELARKKAGIPFVVTSGCRNPEYNAKIGGKSNSAHLAGYAADISCIASHERFIMVRALLEAGFVRIEIGSNWIHADVDPTKPQEVIFLP